VSYCPEYGPQTPRCIKVWHVAQKEIIFQKTVKTFGFGFPLMADAGTSQSRLGHHFGH